MNAATTLLRRRNRINLVFSIPVIALSACNSVWNWPSQSGGPANPASASIITWVEPAPITYGVPLNNAQLNASSKLSGTYVYSPGTGTVLAAGSHALEVTFTPADPAHSPVTSTVTLIVKKAAPVVAWGDHPAIAYGTPLGASQLNASSSVPGTFLYSPAAGSILNGGCQSLLATFAPADATNYSTASATTTIDVIAPSYTFQSSTTHLTIQANATLSTLTELSTGRELSGGTDGPFASVSKQGTVFPATSFTPTGDSYRVMFGTSGVSADYRISTSTGFVVLQLINFEGGAVDWIQLIRLVAPLPFSGGSYLTVRWDQDVSLSLMGLSPKVNTAIRGSELSASAYPEFGLLGQAVAIVASATGDFLKIAQQAEESLHLPSPNINGVWAKVAPENNTSYLFTDLTEANVDDTIRYTTMGGFRYVMIYAPTWASSIGSYTINSTSFPHGEAGLKSVIDKCHAVGIAVGMHMMTSMIGKYDSLVSPTPNPGLLKTGTTSLSASIDARVTSIPLRTLPPLKPNPELVDIQIGDEIIECNSFGDALVQQCKRGFAATRPSAHNANDRVDALAQAAGYYLADLRSPLADAISMRISTLINTMGFDMIYFDGGELNAANGPSWYWTAVHQDRIFQLSRRDLRVGGSGITPWTWHIFARGQHDDFAAVAVKQYLTQYQIGIQAPRNQESFLPGELGWVAFLQSAPDHHATRPDELEYDAVAMLSQNIPLGLETTFAAMEGNGRTEEMFSMLGRYERYRLSDAATPQARARFNSGEWHMTASREFQQVHYDERRLSVPGKEVIQLDSSLPSQPLRFRLRVEPSLAPIGGGDNVDLLNSDSPQEIDAPVTGAVMPGALAMRVPYAEPLDLTRNRALAIDLDVEGAAVDGEVPVLNIQLESEDGNFRDYYVDLSFRGEKTVVLPESTSWRMLTEFWPVWSNYPFKSALRFFDYQHVSALNVRWMRYPASVTLRCSINEVKALQELPNTLDNIEVAIDDARITIPTSMHSGDYAEYWGDGQVRVFNENGKLKASRPVSGAPMLKSGGSTISVSGSQPGDATLTAIELGPPS
jgi:hypothetical protein